jgi:hypothetical protein
MTRRRKSKTNTKNFKDVQDNDKKVKHKKQVKTNIYATYIKLAELAEDDKRYGSVSGIY